MTSFNYLPRNHDVRAKLRPSKRVDRGVRSQFIALAGTLVLLLVVDALDFERLHDVRQRHQIDTERLNQSDISVRHIKNLDRERGRLERMANNIVDIQHSGIIQANHLAWIGNRLPGDLWLSNLRSDNGTYILEGVTERLTAIGSAMLALGHDPAFHPRLISVTRSSERNDRGFHYVLRLGASKP